MSEELDIPNWLRKIIAVILSIGLTVAVVAVLGSFSALIIYITMHVWTTGSLP